MNSIDSLREELSHLKGIEGELKTAKDENRVTLAVLAIVSERLLKVIKGEELVISDKARWDSPDIEAYREGDNIIIRVNR